MTLACGLALATACSFVLDIDGLNDDSASGGSGANGGSSSGGSSSGGSSSGGSSGGSAGSPSGGSMSGGSSGSGATGGSTGGSGGGCTAPERLCGGSCVDVMITPEHCGDCGIDCGGQAKCIDGLCEPIELAFSSLGNCHDVKVSPDGQEAAVLVFRVANADQNQGGLYTIDLNSNLFAPRRLNVTGAFLAQYAGTDIVFTADNVGAGNPGTVHRYNGSAGSVISPSEALGPEGLAVTDKWVIYGDTTLAKIYAIERTWTGAPIVINDDVAKPRGLDYMNGQVVVADVTGDSIRQFAFDGNTTSPMLTASSEIATGIETPFGIAAATVNGNARVYFTHRGGAGYVEGGSTTMFVGPPGFDGGEIAVNGEWAYWIQRDPSANQTVLFRARTPDDVQQLWRGESFGSGPGIDVYGDHVYFCTSALFKMRLPPE